MPKSTKLVYCRTRGNLLGVEVGQLLRHFVLITSLIDFVATLGLVVPVDGRLGGAQA
jgi:hypothetical protein